MRLCSFLGGNGGIALRRHLVEFLRRHHALLIQALHTGVRLLSNVDTGFRLLPHLVGGGNLFLAGALFGLAVLGSGGILGGLSLRQFGSHLGSLQNGERIASVHVVALLDHEFQHTSGHLARHAVFRYVGLPLHSVRFVVESVKTADDNEYYDAEKNKYCG